MDFKYDFQNMRKFIEDVSFIIQSGGASQVVSSAGQGDISKKILNGIKLFFITIVILVVLYVVVKVILGGYPRLLYNVLTMSFYHKENVEDILSNNDVLYSNLDLLGNYVDKFKCNGPYEILDYLYKTQSASSIGSVAKKSQQQIEAYYSDLIYGKTVIKYRYREKYQNAFREYYLFFKVLDTDQKDEKEYYLDPKGDGKYIKFIQQHNTFYKHLIPYLIKRSVISAKNPKKGGDYSQNELMYDMHQNEVILERLGQPTMYQRRYDIHKNLKSLAQNLVTVVRKLKEYPYHNYFLLPNNDLNEIGVATDFAIIEKQILDWNIYERRAFTEINEYTWYIIEVFFFVRNIKRGSSAWKTVTQYLGNKEGYNKNLIVAYLNLPQEKKSRAQTRLFSTSDKPLLDSLQKFPLASKIYYSDMPNFKKEEMYIGVMKLYLKMMSPACNPVAFDPKNVAALVKNLSYYTKPYKELLSSLVVVDLYLNQYRDQLMKMLSTRYLSTENFYRELWTPYFDDYFHNRIVTYWKRIANMKYFKGELYLSFKTKWKLIDNKLMEMNKNVWKAFKQEDTTKQPDPPEEEPNYDKRSYDREASDSHDIAQADNNAAQQELQKELAEAKQNLEKNKADQARNAEREAAAIAESERVKREQAEAERKAKAREEALNKAEEENP